MANRNCSLSQKLCHYFNQGPHIECKGARKGVGVNPPPLELDILQNFITCAKEINCFRILFAC